jgi:hypothetical protein
MHNDHQSLPPDCEIKNNCTRHVITDTLISLASETNYASDMKTLRILRNIKLKSDCAFLNRNRFYPFDLKLLIIRFCSSGLTGFATDGY